jgi:hypothetical protein
MLTSARATARKSSSKILEAMKFKDAPSAADVLCHGQSASTGFFMSVSF